MAQSLKAGISHDVFWDLTPAEAYLSVKAHKSNQDDHARRVAGWVATLANVAGNGPKRPLKPEKLWTPNLVEPKPAPKPQTPDERAEAAAREAERRRKNRRAAQSLDAGLPPVMPSKKR